MIQNTPNSVHDKYAPYWAATLVLLLIAGLSTLWFDFGDFASGYLLDMVGPAWVYILLRGLYTSKADNIWTRFFTPVRTLMILITACFGIEFMQYLNLYASTFDVWDLLAYLSLLTPLFLVDTQQLRREQQAKH
jgi:hypothetical protein